MKRLLAVFRKTLREQLRDLASLSMVLVLCPFFVLLYWLMTGGGTTSYKVLVINNDRGMEIAGAGSVNEGVRVVEAMKAVRTASGAPLLVPTVPERVHAPRPVLDRVWKLLMLPGRVLRASLSTAARASPRATPGLRLKEIVTEGS